MRILSSDWLTVTNAAFSFARRNELEEEVAQLARVKRSWQTEVDVVTKNMEDLHQEQLKEQIKVFRNMKTFHQTLVFRKCKVIIA